jgi:uncharacterized repeat protein (TIGR01451 family)
LSGLEESTTYYYRLSIRDSAGTQNFSIKNFTTPACQGSNPPTVNLTANPSTIDRGGISTLSWNSQNATSCNMSNYGNITTSGTRGVSPYSTTTYTITCQNNAGQTASDSATVTVREQTQNPTVNLTASPSTIDRGGSSTLSWNSQNAEYCNSNWGGSNTSGSRSVSPYSTTTYTITCYNNEGVSASDTATVSVREQEQNPTVDITANPSSIARGQSSTLSWNSQNATSCTLSNAGSVSTSGSRSVSPYSTTTYTITCYNNNGNSAFDSVTVNVNNTQSPTVDLTANPSSITRGQSSTLIWNSQNAEYCNSNWGGSNTSGSRSVSPYSTTTYTITCYNNEGVSASDTATVSVGNETQNPTVNISADDETIDYEDSTTIRWNSNNAEYCTASGGTNGWSGSRNLSGSFNTGSLRNSTTYTIQCYNDSGNSVYDSVTVQVDDDNDDDDDTGGPEVTTREEDDVEDDSATLNGRVDGNGRSTRAWFEYGTDRDDLDEETPDYSYGSGVTNFDYRIDDLEEDTTYYFRAMAENSEGIDRGSIMSFRTDDSDDEDDNDEDGPEVTTRSATNVSTMDATLNGRVDGNGRSTRAWFEYGTTMNLGYSTSRTSYGSGTTTFKKTISGLAPNTLYYFRAVAENSEDTDYGDILTFRTNSGYVPPVINNQPTVVIYADKTVLPYNGSTSIRWSTVNATSCDASGGSLGWAGTKSIGPGSFYTGSLTSNKTFSITCSNGYGSSMDSVTVSVRGQVITDPIIPSSLVLITSSIDRNQPIVPSIDNTRPRPGDEINYTINYQNIGNASITNLTLRLDLPYEVDYIFSNPSNPMISGKTLVFNLGTLKANGQGTVTVRVRVRENAPTGTILDFPATLSYTNPSGYPQSVNAYISAQVWEEPVEENRLGANVFWSGFLPSNLFGWLLLIILILVLIYLVKYVFMQPTRTNTTTSSHH